MFHHRGTESTEENLLPLNRISESVIGAAIDVHRVLGPGLLESAYCECFCRELTLRRLAFKREVPLPVEYKGILPDCGYRIHLVVENSIVIELKSVESIERVHEAQLLTYLKLVGFKLGLLLNFNVEYLKDGTIRRVL